jgi:anti-sigma regulatory factor (Ser/Thr protein kinase)
MTANRDDANHDRAHPAGPTGTGPDGTGPDGTGPDGTGPAGTGQTIRLALPAAAAAVRLARRATRDALAAWQLRHLEETAVLLVSELVTNAVRHARDTGAITLELHEESNQLRVEVQDTDPHWPAPRTPADRDESGFGLVLVDALADQWGVRPTPAGKAVWAELEAGPSEKHEN